ncbi:MAG: HEAT repeat domain-containing protein [Planctomycetota bacterium]|nr:HEAT repeat domain-containing protein [Planctomycetota bacterium]
MSRILNTTISIGSITAILLIMGCVGSDATDDSDAGVQVDAESFASADEQNNGNNSSSDQENATTTTGDSNEDTSISLDPEIGELLRNLGNGSNDERVAASDALRERREIVLASVSDWLKAGTLYQRQGLMLFFTGQAQRFPEQVSIAVGLGLQDKDSKVRSIAIQLIRQLLPEQAAVQQAVLLEAMADTAETTSNRVSIIRLLSVLPGDRPTIESQVGQLAADNNQVSEVQRSALQTYARLAPHEPAIALLLKVLKTSKNDDVCRTAAVLVGKYGSKSESAVAILAVHIETSHADLRDAAAQALARIGRPSVDVLGAALASENLATRQIAIYTLGVIGPSSRAHVKKISSMITNDDEDTNAIARESLSRILQQ